MIWTMQVINKTGFKNPGNMPKRVCSKLSYTYSGVEMKEE
jgi:hypothetical protein